MIHKSLVAVPCTAWRHVHGEVHYVGGRTAGSDWRERAQKLVAAGRTCAVITSATPEMQSATRACELHKRIGAQEGEARDANNSHSLAMCSSSANYRRKLPRGKFPATKSTTQYTDALFPRMRREASASELPLIVASTFTRHAFTDEDRQRRIRPVNHAAAFSSVARHRAFYSIQ